MNDSTQPDLDLLTPVREGQVWTQEFQPNAASAPLPGDATGAGPVPVAPSALPSGLLFMALDPGIARQEEIWALRTDILLAAGSMRRGLSLTVASPGSGEGRSQLAAELAVAFAQLGRPTLLVDADLRRPSQHLLFRIDNSTGLGQALSFGERPRAHVVEGVTNLSVINAGPPVANPLRLLTHTRFQRLARAWRREYAYVVFDSPPLSRHSDALALSAGGTTVLAVSRAHATSQHDMQQMLQRFLSAGVHVAGAVLNEF